MDKKEEFKTFISKHPELISFIKSKEMTFQDFYEIYDIYGDDASTWNKYFKGSSKTNDDRISELSNIIKNINMDSIEHHINNAQKFIGILQELTKKTPVVNPVAENPITKIYGD